MSDITFDITFLKREEVMVDRQSFLDKARPFIGTDVIKVITGIRRCGKSVFLGQIQDEIKRTKGIDAKIIYISLEDEENQRFLAKDPAYDGSS